MAVELGVLAAIWDRVRRERPLVHCITNYVTVNEVANVLLAAGASPAMVDHPKEVLDLVVQAKALYLNPGTMSEQQEESMGLAVARARDLNIPIVLDPVACGVLPYRKKVVLDLIERGKPYLIIKGNLAEIKGLLGLTALVQGVDSLESEEGAKEAAIRLSRATGCNVAATGRVDGVAQVNGDMMRAAEVLNGTEMFTSITGAGCMVGALVAACAAVHPHEQWAATLTGILAFNIAGERAFRRSGPNPGSFRSLLMDELYGLRGEELQREGRIRW